MPATYPLVVFLSTKTIETIETIENHFGHSMGQYGPDIDLVRAVLCKGFIVYTIWQIVDFEREHVTSNYKKYFN